MANATKWLLQYRRFTRPSSSTSTKLMRQLYISVTLPKITYGLDIWYTPPTKVAGQTRNSSSTGALCQLQKVQCIALLAIVGALCTTPTDFLDAHTGLLPIELALLKASHRATIKMLTLPPTHPLAAIVSSIKSNPNMSQKHSSPLVNLIKIFKLTRKKFKIIRLAVQCPPQQKRFTTKVTGLREDLIKWEKEDRADFKVFSDGSGNSEGIGVAAVLYSKDHFTPLAQLKFSLGSLSKHSTFEAEIIGAILAVWLLNSFHQTIGKRVSLYINNQVVLASLCHPKVVSSQYLVRHLSLLANNSVCHLGFHWISGHSMVRGNEKVDLLAKEAVEGTLSERACLPHILRNPLPSSASVVRQAYLAKLRRNWTALWEKSNRSQKMAKKTRSSLLMVSANDLTFYLESRPA